MIATEPPPIEQQAGIKVGGSIKAGEDVEASGAVEAGGEIDAGGAIRAGAHAPVAWTPAPAPQHSGADILATHLIQASRQRESAIKRGETLMRLIVEAELRHEDAAYKSSPLMFYNLAAAVEAWASGSRRSEVPQYRGNPGADLARLKTFVTMEVARLEQG